MLDRICSWLDVHRSGDADDSDGEESSTDDEDGPPARSGPVVGSGATDLSPSRPLPAH